MTKLRTDDPSWASWKFYQDAMKGKAVKVPSGIVSRGYFAKVSDKSKGIYTPVAIWIENEGTPEALKLAQVGTENRRTLDTAEREEDFDYNVCSWASKNPISYEAYQHWMAHGEWPEGHPLRPVPAPAPRVPAAGDNSLHADPDAQASTEFADQVESALAGLAAFEKIETQESADAAQALRNRLTGLAGEGDKAHETAKKPWLEGGRKVDAQWKPTIAKARDGAAKMKVAVNRWGVEEKRRRDEAAQAAAEAGDALAAVAAPVTVGSSVTGRMARIRNTTTPVILDQDEVYRQLRTNPEVVALLEKLVKKVHAAGATLKGVENRSIDQTT